MRKTTAVLLLILGILLALPGLAALAGGAVALALGSARADGYFTAGTARLSVGSHALTSPPLDAIGEGVPPQLPFDVGTLRLRATAVDPAKEIFIGIAPRADVEAYLAGVHHSELLDVDMQPFRAEYRDIPGTAVPAPPGGQGFWAASASGPGEQELTWDIAAGSWSIVLMNADAGQGVDARLEAGARSGLLRPAAAGLLAGGAIALAAGVPLLIFGAMGLGRHANPSPPGARPLPAAAPDTQAPYPARLSGFLDPGLSRAMWLVKWLLAIPHFLVLAFLWFAFLVATVVAWFAILFTGRYPRALFDFNVGVLRWNWRVAFYAYAAAGTDRYPPFTLARTDYPADFDVDYPERLSRGLVLVKSWLLAIPHLVIVGALAGATWSTREETTDLGTTYERSTGLSLLGVLVLVAVIALLFTGRYQRPLFDFILGINRWIYRVIAYTALMRDEYPPFRLDPGAADPGAARPGAAGPGAARPDAAAPPPPPGPL